MQPAVPYPQYYKTALLASLLALAACGGTPPEKTATTGTAAPSAAAISSVGTDFYLTLPDHLCASDPGACVNATVTNKLIIAATASTTGNVIFNGVTTPFSVTAGSSIEIALDAAVVLTRNETVEAKAVHITAAAPVSVHVVSENATSADGYLALPTAGLGTNYRVMSYASSRYTGSEFAIAATQDNTIVTITPTAAGATRVAGMAYTVSMNSGDTYQLQNPANADLSGSLVSADKPVAVFGGHRCADVPAGTGYCDYLVEQLTDTSAWGNNFSTTPFSGRSRYTVRILAALDGTSITSSPAGLVGSTLNAGQFVDLELADAAEFTSNNPVQLAQFINGYADDSAREGDPSMVLVTPAEMGMTESTFGVHGLTGSNGAMMNVVTETSAIASLTLDGGAVNSTLFSPLNSTSKYSRGTLPVAAGAHKLSGSVPFSALVYDYGITWNAVSYAYPVSTMLTLPAAPAVPAQPATASPCVEDNDAHDIYHRFHHKYRHEHHHHRGEYCLIHHTAHNHDGDDHEYECHD